MRIWDIREPQAPVEVAFYVPESNANTNPDGYMTNNVEIDNRGYIYVVDRNGAGFDILQLTGKAPRHRLPGGTATQTQVAGLGNAKQGTREWRALCFCFRASCERFVRLFVG